MKCSLVLTTLFLLAGSGTNVYGEPWSPSASCAVKPRGIKGLHPDAKAALEKAGADHRITRSLDCDATPANYHGPDTSLGGEQVSSAVDISVRCLDAAAIKQLLGHLAILGFAAWYREDGKDGWKGSNHIHAVWAAGPLKRQLRGQVTSWLAGRTGLIGNATYSFWQASNEQQQAVYSAYEKSNAMR